MPASLDRLSAFHDDNLGTDETDWRAPGPRVGLFVPRGPDDHLAALRAFADGLAACGVDHFVTGLDYRACDIAVLFGLAKTAVLASHARGQVIGAHKARGGRCIILEKGFLKRDAYFHCGYDGLNGRADFRNRGMPEDRWRALGIALEPWRRDGDHIVVCGQIPWDASVQHHDHRRWCREVVAALGRLTDRPVRFRPHPLLVDKCLADAGAPRATGPLSSDLAGAWAVVTFNSNSAVEAAVAGIPVFAFDRGSMALAIANSDLAAIERPRRPARLPWLCDLAYAQWNLDELAAGAAWRHLTR